MNKLQERLKDLDAHSSVSSEFRVRTGHGAVLSVVTILSIIWLVRLELIYNLTKETVSTVHVNATSPVGLNMYFDVTFPKVPCVLLSVDANDPTGQAQSLHIDRTHRIFKHRLDSEGKRIGRRSRFEMGDTLLHEDELLKVLETKLAEVEDENDDEVSDEELCGSCYGAADEGECCNTCDDVKRAYQKKNWHIEDLSLIKQCKHQKNSKEETGEGCNINGNIALDTGGGNLHFVPGRQLENFGHEKDLSLADLLMSTFETFNVSHTINRLRFGPQVKGLEYQLDGESRTVEDANGMYQYYLQIVPTTYTRLFSRYRRVRHEEAFQFSVTEHMRHVSPGSNRGLPGVFFFYELSPLHVDVEEVRKGWIRFFTSVCSVVGGIVTLMGALDKVIFDVTRKGSHLG